MRISFFGAAARDMPRDWKRRDGAQFIDFIAQNLNVAERHIYKATRGKGGGTYAHWQIALAYAKYLSPELHMQVNEVYARAKAGDVTLADEIADKASPEQIVRPVSMRTWCVPCEPECEPPFFARQVATATATSGERRCD